MIFDLLHDFSAALDAIPAEHPRRRILQLLDEAIRRDVHFIERHPTTFFQCMWNTCWWYDCAKARQYYDWGELLPSLRHQVRSRAWEAWWVLRNRPSVPLRRLGQACIVVTTSLAMIYHEAILVYIPISKALLIVVVFLISYAVFFMLSPQPFSVEAHPGRLRAILRQVLAGFMRPPWKRRMPRLCTLLEGWRATKQKLTPGWRWVRALRPPAAHLGTGLLAILRGHEGKVTTIAYSPEGRFLVSGSTDKTVRVWDAKTGEVRWCLHGHLGKVTGVACSPNGRYAASISEDETVRIWDLWNGEGIFSLSLRPYLDSEFYSVAYSPDGSCLATGSSGSVVLWNTEDGTLRDLCEGYEQFEYDGVAFSPDGCSLAGGISRQLLIRVWDVQSRKQLRDLSPAGAAGLKYSPDGRRLAGGREEVASICNVQGGWLTPVTRVLRGHRDRVTGVAYSPDGQYLVTGSKDSTIRVWNVAGRGWSWWPFLKALHVLEGHEQGVTCVTYSPDGRHVASSSADATVRIWKVEGGELLRTFRPWNEPISCSACSPDGRWVVVAASDGNVRVWDATSGAEVNRLGSQRLTVNTLAYSPDSRRIAGGTSDGTVHFWDASTGKTLRRFRGHEREVTCVAFSADGRSLVSGSCDKTIRTWDISTGRQVHRLCGHEEKLACVAFSNDGQRIVSSSGSFGFDTSLEGTVRIWNADSGSQLFCRSSGAGPVLKTNFSADGRLIICWSLLAAHGDKLVWTVQVWDAVTGKCLQRLLDADRIPEAEQLLPFRFCAMGFGQRFGWPGQETCVIDAVSGEPVAWFPETFDDTSRPYPPGYTWVYRFHVLRLEGAEL